MAILNDYLVGGQSARDGLWPHLLPGRRLRAIVVRDNVLSKSQQFHLCAIVLPGSCHTCTLPVFVIEIIEML